MSTAKTEVGDPINHLRKRVLFLAALATTIVPGFVAPLRLLKSGWPPTPHAVLMAAGWGMMFVLSVTTIRLLKRNNYRSAVTLYIGAHLLATAHFALFESPALFLARTLLGLAFVLQLALALEDLERAKIWTAVIVLLHPTLMIGRAIYAPLEVLADPSDFFPLLFAPMLILACLGVIGQLTLRALHDAGQTATHRADALEIAHKDLSAARDQALLSSQAKSVFLANMSHELRTPMNAIIGYSELVLEDAPEDFEFHEDVQRIQIAGRQLLELINGILDLAKIEAGKVDLSPSTFNPWILLQELTDTTQQLAQPGTVVELSHPSAHVSITTDRQKLRQILLNLTGNAAKFTKEGRITIRATLAPQRFVVEVVDTGIGIDPAQLERLFDPFTQADETTTREYGGTGLGLAISRQLGELLGGELSASSVAGEGSSFRFSLPTEVTSQPAVTPQQSVPSSEIPNVLLVDDDPDVVAIVERTLSKLNVHLSAVSNGRDALNFARTHRPILIVLDVMMPGIDGFTVLQRLKSDPQTAMIPVTMLTIVSEQSRALALGANEYLLKPINRPRLKALVEHYAAGDHPLNILIIEDDAATREIVSRTLKDLNHNTRCAADGEAGLDALNVERPDLVLLDLMMPKLDGFDVLRRMATVSHHASIPVVVMTAMEMDLETKRWLENRVARIVEKGATASWLQDLSNEVAALLTSQRTT